MKTDAYKWLLFNALFQKEDSMYFRCLAVLCLAGVMLVCGCYRKPSYTPPQTYPVSGKLISPANKQIPANSQIKFVPAEGTLIAEGTLQEDGTFTLKTLFHEEWLPGGVEGKYSRVEIMVPIGLGPLGGQTIRHNESFVIEPKDNQFTVTLR